MLEIGKDLTIYISYGDIFDVTFKIKGLTIEENSKFYLAIKKESADEEPCYLKQLSRVNLDTNSVRIIIESAEMAKFAVGKYYYDLCYIVEGNKKTLNYPARLIVREVVHNEWS